MVSSSALYNAHFALNSTVQTTVEEPINLTEESPKKGSLAVQSKTVPVDTHISIASARNPACKKATVAFASDPEASKRPSPICQIQAVKARKRGIEPTVRQRFRTSSTVRPGHPEGSSAKSSKFRLQATTGRTVETETRSDVIDQIADVLQGIQQVCRTEHRQYEYLLTFISGDSAPYHA